MVVHVKKIQSRVRRTESPVWVGHGLAVSERGWPAEASHGQRSIHLVEFQEGRVSVSLWGRCVTVL